MISFRNVVDVSGLYNSVIVLFVLCHQATNEIKSTLIKEGVLMPSIIVFNC